MLVVHCGERKDAVVLFSDAVRLLPRRTARNERASLGAPLLKDVLYVLPTQIATSQATRLSAFSTGQLQLKWRACVLFAPLARLEDWVAPPGRAGHCTCARHRPVEQLVHLSGARLEHGTTRKPIKCWPPVRATARRHGAYTRATRAGAPPPEPRALLAVSQNEYEDGFAIFS